MSDRNLTRRTPGEDLWLRRRAATLTQAELGRRLGVARTTVVRAEADATPLEWVSRGAYAPSLAELLALARRRTGWGQAATGSKVGVSTPTLLAWERAADPRLVNFWARLGFFGFTKVQR